MKILNYIIKLIFERDLSFWHVWSATFLFYMIINYSLWWLLSFAPLVVITALGELYVDHLQQIKGTRNEP